jgi:hypothetical protein
MARMRRRGHWRLNPSVLKIPTANVAPHRCRHALVGLKSPKLVAFICHGGWIPISAGILRGKRATGSIGIKDDLENAGALWFDEPVVVDGNLISSRTPRDLPLFAKAIIQFLEQPVKQV